MCRCRCSADSGVTRSVALRLPGVSIGATSAVTETVVLARRSVLNVTEQ